MNFEFQSQICIKDAIRGDFSKIVGVYAFINIGNGKIEYIGSATGKNGLRNRIWNQHLNPIYLENRDSVFTKEDIQQLEKGITYLGKIVIEKSMFRKKIARHMNLSPGQECLDYIFKCYNVVYLPLEDKKQRTKYFILNSS